MDSQFQSQQSNHEFKNKVQFPKQNINNKTLRECKCVFVRWAYVLIVCVYGDACPTATLLVCTVEQLICMEVKVRGCQWVPEVSPAQKSPCSADDIRKVKTQSMTNRSSPHVLKYTKINQRVNPSSTADGMGHHFKQARQLILT